MQAYVHVQHEMGARGQPPLAFYLRAMGHAAAALPRPHTRAVVVTAPDQADSLLLTTYCLLLIMAPDQANPLYEYMFEEAATPMPSWLQPLF